MLKLPIRELSRPEFKNLGARSFKNLIAEVARKGAYLLTALQARLGDHPHVGNIRGKGLMCAVDFVKDREEKTPLSALTDQTFGTPLHAAAEPGP